MTPVIADADLTVYCGDALETLRGFPDESVHCVVTSPPYWGLRDYGADGQLGLEATPDEYVAAMVAVFREVRRVLRADGTCWLNLGDSYATTPKGNPGALSEGLTNGGRNAARANEHRSRSTVVGDLKQKDLVGIPWRTAFALQADGWWLRSDIVWSKPNPMPESVTDRPTKAHEYVFLLTRSATYYFDQEAVREPLTRPELLGATRLKGVAGLNGQRGDVGRYSDYANPAGRNVRSVWEIATQPYPDAHFATYPEELVRRCILAGTSERGCCPECGAPWEREVERERDGREFGREQDAGASSARRVDGSRLTSGTGHRTIDGTTPSYRPPDVTTTGWRPTCACSEETSGSEAVPLRRLPGAASGRDGDGAGDLSGVPGIHGAAAALTPVPCIVLDPFLGSGTTAHVARKLGRHAVGIELNPGYVDLIARRTQQQSLLA